MKLGILGTIGALLAGRMPHSQTNPKIRARSSKDKFAKEHSLHGSLNKAIMITDKTGRQKLEKVKIALQKGYITAEK